MHRPGYVWRVCSLLETRNETASRKHHRPESLEFTHRSSAFNWSGKERVTGGFRELVAASVMVVCGLKK